KRAESISLERHGLRVALKRMKTQGISSIFIVNRSNELVGAIEAEAASEALRSGNEDLAAVMEKDIIKTELDTPLNELFDLASSVSIPVAVVDEKNRLRGVIVRGAILAALSGNEVNGLG